MGQPARLRKPGWRGRGPAAINGFRFDSGVQRPLPTMLLDDHLYMGTSTKPEYLLLKYGNRHGLVTGATGTGKTVTLQGLAEGFSRAGVPVFCADVKGDLSGMAMPGTADQKAHEAFTKRAAEIGMTDYAYADNPVIFWDLYGEKGHPIR